MSREKHAKILVTEALEPWAMERLASAGQVMTPDQEPGKRLVELIVDVQALIVRTRTVVDAGLIGAGRQLRVIGRAGVGLDNIALDVARQFGIPVVYTPEAATDAVADLTVALMLDALRKVSWSDREVRAGRYESARSGTLGRQMNELTLGIIGLGRVGRAVARRCHRGFDMKVLFNDIRDPGWVDTPCQRVDLLELVRQSDIVSLHVPLTPLTRGLVDKVVLNEMRPQAILVNTSRGAVVEVNPVVEALKTDRLGAYATDVLDEEPPSPNHPLLGAPRAIITPHIAARTKAAQAAMSSVVEDVVAVLEGRRPRFVANMEDTANPRHGMAS